MALSTGSTPHPLPPASTRRVSRWRGATRAKASTSEVTSFRGSRVPTKSTKGRPSTSRGSTPESTDASLPGDGSSGRKREVSTPWGATTTSASTRHQRASWSAVNRLGQITTVARRAATAIARLNTRTFERSCQFGDSKKLRSCTVTTTGTRARSGMVSCGPWWTSIPAWSTTLGSRSCSQARRTGRRSGTDESTRSVSPRCCQRARSERRVKSSNSTSERVLNERASSTM